MTARYTAGGTKILSALKAFGDQEDNDIDIGETALLLAALDQPDADLTVYREHLSKIAARGRRISAGDLHPQRGESGCGLCQTS